MQSTVHLAKTTVYMLFRFSKVSDKLYTDTNISNDNTVYVILYLKIPVEDIFCRLLIYYWVVVAQEVKQVIFLLGWQ